jgi:hypothetical protein
MMEIFFMESRYTEKERILTTSTAFALVAFATLYTTRIARDYMNDSDRTSAYDTACDAASVAAFDFLVRFMTDNEHGLISLAYAELPRAWNYITEKSRNSFSFFYNQISNSEPEQEHDLRSRPSPSH